MSGGRSIARMRRAWRRVVPERGPAAVILAYHRVADLATDPQLLAVPPQRFEKHLRALTDEYRLLSLAELLAARASGRVPDRSVAITFDDGYADALLEAKPLLVKYGACGTVFVTAGPVVDPREFWWDELETIVLSPGVLPKSLELEPGLLSFDLSGDEEYTEADAKADRSWNVLSMDSRPRQRLYRALCELLRPLDAGGRIAILDRLHDWSGTPQVVRETHRALHPDELPVLEAGGTVSVGAHTMTHQLLSARTEDEQHEEISSSKRVLEDLCGHTIDTFAYPYGVPGDFTDATAGIVRETGFSCACANDPGLVRASTDSYSLPRYLVRDWSGEELLAHLEGWFDGR